MCAIVDANVASQVFGTNPTPAGAEFFKWINSGRGKLITGGKQLDELVETAPGFRDWASEAIRSGKVKQLNEAAVRDMSARIAREKKIKSNDPHVLAVAQLSGARLLFSNDKKLRIDFRRKDVIDNPRGRIYSSIRLGGKFTSGHKRLLGNRSLCRG